MDPSIEEKVVISNKSLVSEKLQNCSKDFIKVAHSAVSNTSQAFTDCLTKKLNSLSTCQQFALRRKQSN